MDFALNSDKNYRIFMINLTQKAGIVHQSQTALKTIRLIF